MWRPDGLSRQEADRKCLLSQPSPQWRQEVVGSGEGAGAGPEGAAPSRAEIAPGTGSYSSAGAPPGQTPGAPSPSAARRSQPPALPSPPPVCPSPAGRESERNGGRETGARQRWVKWEEKGGRCAAERDEC